MINLFCKESVYKYIKEKEKSMKNFKIKGIVFSTVAILTIANSTIISHADVAVENSPTLSGTPALCRI